MHQLKFQIIFDSFYPSKKSLKEPKRCSLENNILSKTLPKGPFPIWPCGILTMGLTPILDHQIANKQLRSSIDHCPRILLVSFVGGFKPCPGPSDSHMATLQWYSHWWRLVDGHNGPCSLLRPPSNRLWFLAPSLWAREGLCNWAFCALKMVVMPSKGVFNPWFDISPPFSSLWLF